MPPRTPLLRPDRYFAEREPNFFRVALVVGLLIAAGPAVVYGVGWVLAGNLDGTVLVDNPEHPPDWVCESDGADSAVFDEEDCDAPERIERNVDAILWDAVEETAGTAILAYPLVLAILTLSTGSCRCTTRRCGEAWFVVFPTTIQRSSTCSARKCGLLYGEASPGLRWRIDSRTSSKRWRGSWSSVITAK